MGSAMKRQLNYNLLLFHVHGALEEMDVRLLRIKKMLGGFEESHIKPAYAS